MSRRLLLLLPLLQALSTLPATALPRVFFDGVEHLANGPDQDLDVNFGTRRIGDIGPGCLSLGFSADSEGGTVELVDPFVAPFYVSEPLVGTAGFECSGSHPAPGGFPVHLTSGQAVKLIAWVVPHQVGLWADALAFRVTPKGGTASTFRVNAQVTGSATGPCIVLDEMCLNDGRFRIQAAWSTADGSDGSGQAVRLTDDSGYFFFFHPANIEALVKVLNACALNNHYWVFAGGLTNVRTILSVTDTEQGSVRTYINPLGKAFLPIQDTSAFATCP